MLVWLSFGVRLVHCPDHTDLIIFDWDLLALAGEAGRQRQEKRSVSHWPIIQRWKTVLGSTDCTSAPFR